MFREATMASLPVPPDLSDFKLMEALNLAQIVVGMSPLVLLSCNKTPRKGIKKVPWFQVYTISVHKISYSIIVQYVASLGNSKPHALQEVEKLIWLAVLQIANGDDSTPVLEKLFLQAKDIVTDEPHCPSWFTLGTTVQDICLII
jgi:hypothetical protein